MPKNRKNIKPPFIAAFILNIILADDDFKIIAGDYEEYYKVLYEEQGKRAAKKWYWKQLLNLIPRKISNSLYWGGLMLLSYIKTAFRNIIKHKGFSVVNILGLSIGIASFILISLYIQYENSWDQYHKDADRIYLIHQNVQLKEGSTIWDRTVYPLADRLKETYPEIDEVFRLKRVWSEYLSVGDNTYKERDGFYADNEILDVFNIEFIDGNKKNALKEPNTILLTKSLAQKYFPGENPVGKFMKDVDSRPLKVTGLIKEFPENSHVRPSYILSYETFAARFGDEYKTVWSENDILSYVKLKENTNLELFNKKIANFQNQFIEKRIQTIYLKPLIEIHTNPEVAGDKDTALIKYYYGALGLFILILACMNFINITTAYSSVREKEIAVRKVIGGNRSSLVKQFMGESIVLSLISMILAFILAEAFMPVYNNVVMRNLTIDYINNSGFVLVMILAAVSIGVISGFYPSLYLSSFNPIKIFRGSTTINKKGKPTGKGGLRKVLVVFQFTISLMLVMNTLYVSQHINYLKNKPLGFNEKQILMVHIRSDISKEKYETVKNELLRSDAITNVSLSYNAPFWGSWGNTITWEGGDDQEIQFNYNGVDESFIETFGMEIIKGRNFSDDFASDENTVIINETAARLIGWDDPIGKWINPGKRKVIGVVKDFHHYSIHEKIRPYYFRNNRNAMEHSHQFSFRFNPGMKQEAKNLIKSTLRNHFPKDLFEVNYMDKNLHEGTIAIWNGVAKTFGFFAALAIFIAVIGLFSLISFAVKRRIKEIGIRKILGAKVPTLYFLINKEFMTLLLISMVIAVPIMYLTEDTMPGAYRYESGIWDYILPCLGLIIISFFTTAYKAISAAMATPVDNLRTE